MLVLTSGMQAYFREALDSAMRQTQIQVTESAQIYLVNLLKEFSRSDTAFSGVGYGEKIVFTDLLERAANAKSHEALQIFRHLGDTSLYLLGFFKGSALQRLASKNYYRDMGIQGYLNASHLSRAYRASNAALFWEMSERFNDLLYMMEFIAKYDELSDIS